MISARKKSRPSRRHSRKRWPNCTLGAGDAASGATPDTLGIIGGNGVYPRLLADAARRAGVIRIVAAAFTDETDKRLISKVDEIQWMRVGQLGKLISFFNNAGVSNAIMAGAVGQAT